MTTDLEATLLWNSPCISTLGLGCENSAWVGENVVHPEPFLAGIPRQGFYVLDTSRKDLMKEQCVTMQALPCQLILEVPLLLGATTLSEQGQG